MPNYKFTSNIMCENCEASVKSVLDNKNEVKSFKVDLNHKERPVVIETNKEVEEKELMDWVSEAGFVLKPKSSFLKKLFK